MTFETLSSTERSWQAKNFFSPDTYVNIKKEIKDKIKAFKYYKSEIKNYPHPRSFKGIENLAMYRGNQVGLEFAEAFCTIKNIIK